MRATRLLLALALPLGLLVTSCGDDDGNPTQEPDAQPLTQCSDGVDNDADGLIDFPLDPGCEGMGDDTEEDTIPLPQCRDGRDNDGDGKIDFPADPACFNAETDMEIDDCPDGTNCPQCGNGRDDDMNGTVDFPDDPGCDSAADTSEFIDNPNACGPVLKVVQLPGDGIVEDELTPMSSTSLISECSANAGVPALAYSFQLTEPKVVVASTDNPLTSFDSVLSIRSSDCVSTPAIACNDDVPGAPTSNKSSRLEVSLEPGTYYLIVQGWDASEMGTFRLQVDRFAGEGASCAVPADCGPGLVCRTPVGGSALVCADPVCSDGLDDDADGKIDFPADPGCNTVLDDSETDDCPTGPNCPDCADGVDNDADGQVDYPADVTCQAASNTTESCASSEGVPALTMPVTMGNLATATNDVPLYCTGGAGGKDLTYRLDVPAMTSLTINTTGADTVNSLLNASCGTPTIMCSDSASITRPNVAAGTYYFVADAYAAAGTGTLSIAVSGTIATGGSCEGPLAVSGAISCASGFSCGGTAGARTCRPAACSDGMDNNGDGRIDYPLDPGCTSVSDGTEDTVCPGANCPQCADGLDNDGDTSIDYPNDAACVSASGTSELCRSSEVVATVTTATVTGTTVGAGNEFSPCGASTSTAPDVTYRIDTPALSRLSIALTPTGSWSAQPALYNATCGGSEVGSCGTSDTVVVNNVLAGTYFYVVDGTSATASGAFTFTVSGTIAPGASCDSALTQAGAFTCSQAGYACKGPAGMKTCQPSQCGDGIDNNGNGRTDYPNDPGCASPQDDTETTVCPGAGCPQCSNTTDDDADTLVDYPADFGCAAAGSNSEVFCPSDPDFGSLITMPVTTGTLATGAANVSTTCGTGAVGNDRAFALQLPVAVASLQLDTMGSASTDTVLQLRDSTCGTPLGCDDDGAATASHSKLTVTNMAAGTYAVTVKAYGTDDNLGITLNTSGIVAPMTACSSPLFASGVLACPTGTTCTGAGAAAKCQ